MIRYLIDSSALWRIMREAKYREGWQEVIAGRAVGSCAPQRAEFRNSARSLAEYEQMNDMFTRLHPEVKVPKAVWQWIESAQYRLAGGGMLRSMSAVDLLVAGTAAHQGLTVLHDDNDYRAAARHLPDLRERSVRLLP
ncbi:PIN domain-containing protein [Nocardiopsis composta]|uniref:Ribonuclease VapC n=1 Tax=Nocardiopsis composta TaxID=157465 RepID=A0A7W8QNI1_9ACTN|nr:PIN domain-containing protein [Nocardiopsis composta]MBB5433244.1 putative nucleic acid-binding protein [Nocardiopsis composta]